MRKGCSVAGCDLPHDAKGMCKKHYLRWRRTGSTERTRPVYSDQRTLRSQLTDKLMGSIRKLDNGCWVCDCAALSSSSKYPRITLDRGKFGYARESVHRLSYEHHKGEIPDGMLVCHTCDNRLCCNPEHLFLGTHKDNAQDASNKDRTLFGEKAKSAKLTEAKVIEIYDRHDAGHSERKIGKEFGVSNTAVRHIITGRNWTRLYKQHRGRDPV